MAEATIEGRNDALISRSGVYCGGEYYDFDQANVREDHTHSFFKGSGSLHPFDGVTDPIDLGTFVQAYYGGINACTP